MSIEKAKHTWKERNETKRSINWLLLAGTAIPTYDMMCPADGQQQDDEKKDRRKTKQEGRAKEPKRIHG